MLTITKLPNPINTGDRVIKFVSIFECIDCGGLYILEAPNQFESITPKFCPICGITITHLKNGAGEFVPFDDLEGE